MNHSTSPSFSADEQETLQDRSWTDRLAHHRTGLAALSFAESTIVPIPLEALVVPLMIGHPKRSIAIATVIWIGCIVGASLLYAVGFWLAQPVMMPVIEWLGLASQFDQIAERLSQQGLFWTVFLISLLPAPMQLAALGAGSIGGNFLVFLAAIMVSRGIRYYGLAVLAQLLGERLRDMHIPTKRIVLGVAVVLLGGWGLWQVFG